MRWGGGGVVSSCMAEHVLQRVNDLGGTRMRRLTAVAAKAAAAGAIGLRRSRCRGTLLRAAAR